MAHNVLVSWTVDNLTAVLVSFDQCKVYRADTETGTYNEITGLGTRVNMTAPTVNYDYTDSGVADLTKWYRISFFHSSTGLESDLSYPKSPAAGNVAITAQNIKAAYVSPFDLQADYVEFPPRFVSFTSEGLYSEGNRPYVIGTDYDLLVALLYNDEDTGLQEGIDLSGCTVDVTVVDATGTTVVAKTNGSGVTLESQGTKFSDGGYMGVFRLTFANSEDDYTPGRYKVYCRVTYTSTEIAEQFYGDIDFLANG